MESARARAARLLRTGPKSAAEADQVRWSLDLVDALLEAVEQEGEVHPLRPPCPAEVELRGGRPAFVRGEPVVRLSGPTRVRIGFGAPALHDYYDVEIEGGVRYRICHDLASESWFIDA